MLSFKYKYCHYLAHHVTVFFPSIFTMLLKGVIFLKLNGCIVHWNNAFFTQKPEPVSSGYIVCSTAERPLDGTRARGHHNVRRTQVGAASAAPLQASTSVGDHPFPQNKEFNFKWLWNQQKPQAPLMAAHLALWNGSVEMSTLESKAHRSKLLYWKGDMLSRQLSVADKKRRTMADGVCGFWRQPECISAENRCFLFCLRERDEREEKKKCGYCKPKNTSYGPTVWAHIY